MPKKTPKEKAIESWSKPETWFGCALIAMVVVLATFIVGFCLHCLWHFLVTGWNAFTLFKYWVL